jgi:hypothetical protein
MRGVLLLQRFLYDILTKNMDTVKLRSIIAGICWLILGLVINIYAVTFATSRASSSVTDIILSNTRVFDLDGFFVYGSIILWLFIVALLVKMPNKIPFALKSIGLFIIIRSIFITLTHIGPFPFHIVINADTWVSTILGQSLFQVFFTGNDFFFSGHTGIPFLMALLFWDYYYLRIFFVVASLMFAVVVLLTHLHYTIDVLSAFFITYSIYCIAKYFFAEDYRLFIKN